LPAWQFPTIVTGFILKAVLKTRQRHAGALSIATSIVAAAMTPHLSKPEPLISEDGEPVAVFHDGCLEPNRGRPRISPSNNGKGACGV
jgi:competence protein ComEC